MDIEALRSFLGWCTLLNWGLLLIWWAFVALGADWMFELHGKWFKISRQTFDGAHYAGMALFKVLVFVFNLVPYLVLRFFF